MANLSNINNILRISSSGVGLNKDNTGPSELDIESAGADMIDMTRTGLKTYRFAISGSSDFSIFDVAANDDRLVINSAGNVNIGSSLSSEKLEVGGTIRIRVANTSSATLLLNNTDTQLSIENTGGNMIFSTAGAAEKLRIDTSGNATFTGSIDAGNRIKVSGGNSDQYYFEGARNGVGVTYRLYDNANNIYHDSYTSQVFRLNQNGGSGGDLIITGGDVGIGTSGPIEKLQVRTTTTTDDSFQGINVQNFGTSGARAGISFKCYDWVQSAIWHGRSATAAYGGALVLGTNPDTSDLTVAGVTGRMWILNNGNVGIGTNSPTANLTVESPGNQFHIRANTATAGKFWNFDVTSANQLYIINSANTHYLTIQDTGNVGIGTTSPSGALHVKSSAATTTGMVRLQNDMDNNYETLRVESLGNYDAHIGFHTAGSSTYWWGIGIDYSDSGKFKISGDNILSVNPRLTIDTSGNVGINTTAPTAKLDIAGDVRYQGSIYSEYTYNGSGNYSSGTIYTIASTGQLTINGIYQIVMYLDDYGVGGGTYFSWFCSVPFYWVTTGTNRVVSQNLPPLIGTGHAIGTIPTFTITQELGTSGGQSKIRFNPQNNWTGINGTSGKQFIVYIKRLGG